MRSRLGIILFSLLFHLPYLYAGTVPLPSYPLAVRSPYLTAWLPGNASANATTAQPTFWSGAALHWVVISRVNSHIYCLFGCHAKGPFASTPTANQTSINYTSTHTYINLNAGPATFVLDFFSPVSPKNLIRHSFPYSYLNVHASGANVQVFSAIDDSWYGDRNSVAPNVTSTSGGTTFFQLYDKNATLYSQSPESEIASWGSVVFASQPSPSSKLTSQCGNATDILTTFKDTGALSNATKCSRKDSWALSHDMGNLTGPSNVTFAIGQQRYETIDYQGTTQVSFIYSKYNTVSDTLDSFFADLPDALHESYDIDRSIREPANAISSNYADICEASVRQHYGASELTVSADTKDANNPWVWSKEISSGGKVDSIDVIYPALPILMVTNPYWIRWYLDPILQYIASQMWNQEYIVHDLGSTYPKATRDQDFDEGEEIPLQITGAFFTLAYAYQQATKDTAWLAPYISRLTRFANYLMDNGAEPYRQLSTVDQIGARPNRTDLAIQAAIGLKSFGLISGMQNYTKAATDMANQLYVNGEGLNANRTHFTFQYGHDEGWTIIFNSYIDKMLNLQLFPEEAWSMQSSFYATQVLPGGMPYAGGNVDCGHGNGHDSEICDWAITDWAMWAAATCEEDVMHKLIEKSHEFLVGGTTNVPLSTKYFVFGPKKGKYFTNRARGTVGSNFAMLAFNGTSKYPGSVGPGPGGSGRSSAGDEKNVAAGTSASFVLLCVGLMTAWMATL